MNSSPGMVIAGSEILQILGSSSSSLVINPRVNESGITLGNERSSCSRCFLAAVLLWSCALILCSSSRPIGSNVTGIDIFHNRNVYYPREYAVTIGISIVSGSLFLIHLNSLEGKLHPEISIPRKKRNK